MHWLVETIGRMLDKGQQDSVADLVESLSLSDIPEEAISLLIVQVAHTPRKKEFYDRVEEFLEISLEPESEPKIQEPLQLVG